MTNKARHYTFGARIAFLFEKFEQIVSEYDVVSLAEEKVILAQKLTSQYQLSWAAGRSGV